MKIAVNYENGQIFQHFGRTEQFKLYYVENGKVIDSEIVDGVAEKHEALADQLGSLGVDVVICGGLGDGMIAALQANGIAVCAGISGDCDEAVQKYLTGELEYESNANCDHEEEEEEGCGGCGGSCGGCGGGCGGCGGREFKFDHDPVGNEGKKCKVHYTGTFDDGTKFDSSYDRGEPLEFICGVGMMIKGFDKAVIDMQVGDIKEIHLEPDEAYGYPSPNNIITFEISELAGSSDLEIGQRVYLSDSYGQPVPVKVVAKDETRISLDANHEMAGKALNFKIELVDVQ